MGFTIISKRKLPSLNSCIIYNSSVACSLYILYVYMSVHYTNRDKTLLAINISYMIIIIIIRQIPGVPSVHQPVGSSDQISVQ